MRGSVLLLTLCVILILASCDWRPVELVCTGKITWGKQTFPDKLVLRVWQLPFLREVEIAGQAGQLSTFEAGLQYRTCFESMDQLDFEYTTSQSCGSGASTRHGRLYKVTGNLQLSRSDRGESFVGEYQCKPTKRVLD